MYRPVFNAITLCENKKCMNQYKLSFIRQHYITTTCYCYETLHNMLSNIFGTTHIAEVKVLIRTLKRNVQHQRMTLAEKCMLYSELIGEAICPALQSRMQSEMFSSIVSCSTISKYVCHSSAAAINPGTTCE